MDEKRESTLAEEAGLPDSWHPVDSAPINPAAAIGSPNPMANFFSGPISPTLQHDVNFVNTQLGTYNIAKLPLVPLAASGQPSVGAAVQSGSTTTINNSVNAVAGGPNGAIQFNNGGALAGSSVLTFNNASNIVTITGSVNVSGSLILTGNISASVFNATTGFQIAGAATAGHYLRGNGTDFISAVLSGTDVLAGIVGVTYGGTGANLSATGGTSEVLMQTTIGGAITVAQLAASNLSNGTTGTGAVVLAGSPTLTGTTLVAALTASGLIIGQGNIQLGVAGATSGVVTLEGSTSGAATITAPAVAGTATNPIAISNSINIPTGSTYQINGVPLSSSAAFSAITGGTNTAAAMVVGTGASLTVSGSGTVTATGLTGTPAITVGAITATTVTASGLIAGNANIQLGVAGTTSGVITLEGSTSGAATITAPAVAGTTTNPIAFSNSINIPTGTALSWNSDTFIYRSSANVIGFGNAIGSANGTLSAGAFFGGTLTGTTLTLTGATPSTAAGRVGFGVTAGFGNGTPVTPVTTTTLGTGSGPATPGTIVKYLEIDMAGTKFWIPLTQ